MIYRFIIAMIRPFVPWFLKRRLAQGKEEKERLSERYGISTKPAFHRPCIWIHGASMGESQAALVIIDEIRRQDQDQPILVTTTTITAAKIMAKRLPNGVVHQYLPLDHPAYLRDFLIHWQPKTLVLIESELWPVVLKAAKSRGVKIFFINGRCSSKSYCYWRFAPSLMNFFSKHIDEFYAQSPQSLERFMKLGVTAVRPMINLKFATTVKLRSGTDSPFYQVLQDSKSRLWLAASTHEGEDIIVLNIQARLRRCFPSLTLVIAPRYLDRLQVLKDYCLDLRLSFIFLSEVTRDLDQIDLANIAVIIVDTFGLLQELYDDSSLVFVGGSLVPAGGHSIIEPCSRACVAIVGPHHFNLEGVLERLEMGVETVENEDELEKTLRAYLNIDASIVKFKGKQGRLAFQESHEQAVAFVQNLVPRLLCTHHE